MGDVRDQSDKPRHSLLALWLGSFPILALEIESMTLGVCGQGVSPYSGGYGRLQHQRPRLWESPG